MPAPASSWRRLLRRLGSIVKPSSCIYRGSGRTSAIMWIHLPMWASDTSQQSRSVDRRWQPEEGPGSRLSLIRRPGYRLSTALFCLGVLHSKQEPCLEGRKDGSGQVGTGKQNGSCRQTKKKRPRTHSGTQNFAPQRKICCTHNSYTHLLTLLL